MKKGFRFFLVFLFILSLAGLSIAQETALKPNLGFEYLSRRINWDENTYKSNLSIYLFSFGIELEIKGGFQLNLLAGYSSTNYDGLVFRKLPFSIDLNTGGTGGYLFGAQLEKRIFSHSDFEATFYSQFYYSYGIKKTWQITALNVTGKIEGKPHWLKSDIGSVFRYTGFEYFYPYIYVNYCDFRGTYKMDETVQDLEGSESKKILGEGNFCISIGATYDVSEVFSIKGEASFIPYREGVDIGFVIRASYNFLRRKS